MVTQRDIDIWRIEAKEKIRKMYEDWRKDYLGRRMNINPGYAARNAEMNEAQDGNRRASQSDY